MFNSSILDMVILLFFTYFICSVLLSVIIEIIASLRDSRANDLETNLKTLLFDPKWGDFVINKIFTSPYYESLKETASKNPSYMPSENFAKAILESLRTGNSALDIGSIKTKLQDPNNGLPDGLQKILLGYLDTAGNDVKNLQTQIEGFYNNAMDRASGWYKIETKKISFIVSIILVLVLNVDTLEIIQKSTQNPEALKVTADRISADLPKMKYDGKVLTFTAHDSVTQTIYINKGDSLSIASLQNQYNNFTDIKKQLQNSVFSLGYKDFCKEWRGGYTWAEDGGMAFLSIILKLIGMTITVLALQVGSTYWFDALNKVVNLRGTGKKPDPAKPDDAKPATP